MKKNYKKRAPMKKKYARKGLKKQRNTREYASCSVARTLAPADTNVPYSFDSITLADYQRAVAIARNYQRYRISSVKVTWKPTFDTYSAALALQKPRLYYMIDKNGSVPDNVTLEGLKQMGARPRELDEKSISVTFKPAVLGEARINAGIPQAASYLVSPWLSTAQNPTAPGAWNPSEVSHQGIKFFIENFGGNQQIQMQLEVQFQFIKPLFPSLAATPARGLTYAVLDDSPDGIVGGSDVSPSLG